jgi:hypothetical protein
MTLKWETKKEKQQRWARERRTEERLRATVWALDDLRDELSGVTEGLVESVNDGAAGRR